MGSVHILRQAARSVEGTMGQVVAEAMIYLAVLLFAIGVMLETLDDPI